MTAVTGCSLGINKSSDNSKSFYSVYITYFICMLLMLVFHLCKGRNIPLATDICISLYAMLVFSFICFIGIYDSNISTVLLLVYLLTMPMLMIVPTHYAYGFLVIEFIIFSLIMFGTKSFTFSTFPYINIINITTCFILSFIYQPLLLKNRISLLAKNEQLAIHNKFIRKTFGRYLSNEIVKTILESENGLEIGGKNQKITAMFTDLRGFTAISETVNSQDLIKMLNHYLSEMIDVISLYRGTIIKFIGDSIFVVFGAPIEDNHAEYNAVACAIDMQCKMKEVNDYNVAHGFPKIEMGIGLHSGEAVVGNIGSKSNTKYDVIGKTVNLASRIETLTVGGQVMVSDTIRDLLHNDIKTKSYLEITPKGMHMSVKIYSVESLGEHRIPIENNEFIFLDSAINIFIHVVDQKTVMNEETSAQIIAVSSKQAIIVCNNRFKKYTNIKFDIDTTEVYAKVVANDNDKIIIHYTMGSIPQNVIQRTFKEKKKPVYQKLKSNAISMNVSLSSV